MFLYRINRQLFLHEDEFTDQELQDAVSGMMVRFREVVLPKHIALAEKRRAVVGVAAKEKLQEEEGIKLIPPDPEFCAATLFSISLGSAVKGAIIVPSEEVNVHGKNIVEILAGLRLRDALGVVDGDLVTLAIDVFV